MLFLWERALCELRLRFARVVYRSSFPQIHHVFRESTEIWGLPVARAAVARATRPSRIPTLLVSLTLLLVLSPLTLLSPLLALLPFLAILLLCTWVAAENMSASFTPAHHASLAFTSLPRRLLLTIPTPQIARCRREYYHPRLPVSILHAVETILAPLTPAARETFWALAPEFEGTLADLLDLSATLSRPTPLP